MSLDRVGLDRAGLDRATLLDIFGRLTLCREFELALITHATKDAKGVGHPSMGQEGVAAGVISALLPDDRVMSTHRTHAHSVAKGCDLERLALELYGSGEGVCRGRSGEMYLAQTDVGYFGGTQIVAGNIAMATGLALGSQLSGADQVAVAFVGDGGVNQGVLWEALNLAAIWRLPFILVIENNGYAQTTRPEYSTAGSVSERAGALGIVAVDVDGQSAVDVHAATAEARRRAVAGEGPSVIVAKTYRFEGHFYGDRHRAYRPVAEVEQWLARDPVALHRAVAEEAGVGAEELDALTADAAERSRKALERARTGRKVTIDDLLDGGYVDADLGTRARTR